jgi:hypothetical protein
MNRWKKVQTNIYSFCRDKNNQKNRTEIEEIYLFFKVVGCQFLGSGKAIGIGFNFPLGSIKYTTLVNLNVYPDMATE